MDSIILKCENVFLLQTLPDVRAATAAAGASVRHHGQVQMNTVRPASCLPGFRSLITTHFAVSSYGRGGMIEDSTVS